MRGPYTYSNSRDHASRELFFRIADGDDNAICFCYSEFNARAICECLNRDWIESMQKPLKISLAGVRLSGRAAKTPKAKTGRSQKRRAAKRDKGTAKGRADAGSIPAPGFPKLKNVRYF